MLPNILRCMKPFEHKESETPENRKVGHGLPIARLALHWGRVGIISF